MQCTHTTCNKSADFQLNFEINTDLSIRENEEFLCESCATKVLMHGLANRQTLRLKRYIPIE